MNSEGLNDTTDGDIEDAQAVEALPGPQALADAARSEIRQARELLHIVAANPHQVAASAAIGHLVLAVGALADAVDRIVIAGVQS